MDENPYKAPREVAEPPPIRAPLWGLLIVLGITFISLAVDLLGNLLGYR